MPAAEPDDVPVKAWSAKEKIELQEKIDALDDEQLESVLLVLREELGVGEEDEEEVSLDIDNLPPSKQRRFLKIVEAEYRKKLANAKKRKVAASEPPAAAAKGRRGAAA